MTHNNSFLTAVHLNYTFEDGPLHVLADISLRIERGAFVVIVGPSGVGKSTLLRLLAGLLRPSTGQITLDNQPASAARDPIGLVFQRDNLMPWRTVTENVRLPLELQGKNGRTTQQRVQEMIELVGLAGFEGSYPAQLSGGMAQRVALARALVHEPELLLLDEPFGALDALTRERMGQELLRIWQAMPVTVFMVTHSIAEAVLLADEVLVMGGDPGNGRPATITHHIPIHLSRPRQFAMQSTAEFQEYAAQIRAAIQQ
ncbi:MAG: ABC transporter ATP-binding protein [Ardenticatenaceae bacterium]|nr:ABC transporter ATP-binding protein [Ardenticatenaceae bacterium]